MARGTRSRLLEEVPEGLADEIERKVGISGAVQARELAALRLSRTARARLEEDLGRRGLERTGRAIRLPLAAQIDRLLAAGSPIPLTPISAIKKRLAGVGTAAELRHAIEGRVTDRAALFVASRGTLALVRAGDAALSAEELAALSGTIERLVKLVKATRPRAGKPRPTLLREDVTAIVATIADLARPPGSKDGSLATIADLARPPGSKDGSLATIADPSRPPGSKDGSLATLLDAVRRLEAPARRLVFVPALVRALAPALGPDAAREALVRAAREGQVELRPESGLGTLAPADAALCPAGADGSPLSYVRRLAP